MNKRYEDCLFHSKGRGIFSKINVDGLFAVSGLEKCLNFGKDVATEKELISSRGNVELMDENKIYAYHRFNLEVSGESHKVAYIHYMKIKKLIGENVKKLKI